MDFIKILSDLAREYQNTPEGREKEELKKIIDKAADIIYGKVTITDLNGE
ncbi:hypothetical protein TM902_150001 [Tenacibaculum maritimum]|nr:hypothetical protein [Tenacibaculum maritimum]CAA0144487.1 hypothetical protein TM902_150001 [Tenacibaculum maritimum]CAA0155011.1 hypothetical protein TMFC_100098 [Tenacibaculum maritimum]CAA0159412.1 hypothetical protein AQ1688_220004 [Tenacibaculum maritimum]CAA0167146.1 hypothetical protein AQ1689_30098 [Tenacibaculum maritimum]CAA0170110.1 hypothetical protein AQ1685_30055 [Tenacibaculum maritimum]